MAHFISFSLMVILHIIVLFTISETQAAKSEDANKYIPSKSKLLKAKKQNTAEDTCSSCCVRGEPGAPGPPGNPGIPGMPGNHGGNGHNGIQGLQGSKGDRGKDGKNGVNGKLGERGPKGPSGQRGQPGLQGRAGPRGPPGAGMTQNNNVKVAFSAARVAALSADSDMDEIVTYGKLFINVGDCFDQHTGIFTAKVRGAYAFTFHIHTASRTSSPYVKLMKNGDLQVAVHDYDSSDAYDSTSNSVTLDLMKSDMVWLQLDQGNELHSNSNRYTTFMGHLLFTL
ncbi:complement C1q tumor necrosis factor-related protein 3-like [Anneissia japonica]|uniref:complement C1q tumor necrosis factor-related protein 3-like n=1 Tax=Anneissia japonica TaxID=1529436 RepID=UPI0014259AEA|nr:complement C1q tumor necrosis factor-related protein 3-like [Anneissia japonica]